MPKIPMRSFTGPTDGTVVVGPGGTLVTASSGGPTAVGSSTEAGLPGTASPGSVSYLTDKGTLAFRTSTGWQKAIPGSGILSAKSTTISLFAPYGSEWVRIPLLPTLYIDTTTYTYDTSANTITVNGSGHYVVGAAWHFRTTSNVSNAYARISVYLNRVNDSTSLMYAQHAFDNNQANVRLCLGLAGTVVLTSGDVLEWSVFRFSNMELEYMDTSFFHFRRLSA